MEIKISVVLAEKTKAVEFERYLRKSFRKRFCEEQIWKIKKLTWKLIK